MASEPKSPVLKKSGTERRDRSESEKKKVVKINDVPEFEPATRPAPTVQMGYVAKKQQTASNEWDTLNLGSVNKATS
jgi:hypothetical protein